MNLLNQLKKTFFISRLTEFTTIIRTNNDVSKTTRIKAIDNFYPLIGEAIVEPSHALETLKNTQNTILIDTGLQNNLNLKLGDEVKIQNISFEVIGFIKRLPDIRGFFFW